MNNVPVPDGVKNAPTIIAGLEFYYTSFAELTTERQIGMAEGPIPVSAIRRYAAHHSLGEFEYDRLKTLIKGMDSAYLKYRSDQMSKPSKPIGTNEKEEEGLKIDGS